LKKNWTKIAIALGPAILISTIVWEYARTNPDYNFLIQPWAVRGYEAGNHGWIFVAMGVLLLVGGLLTSWEGSMKPSVSAGVTAYLLVAATGFTAFFTLGTPREEITITISTVNATLMSMLLAAAFALSLRSLLRERSVIFKRALPVFVVTFALFFVLMSATVAGSEVTSKLWIVVFVVFLLVAGLAIAIRPSDVAANRMLIFTTVAAWVVVVLSAGAIRQTLLDAQTAFDQGGGVTGVSAQYKDTQVAGGWWLAGLAMTLLFVGAVGLWAKRRDIVAAMDRARKQRAAAEQSSREIQEALEAFEREEAARS